MKYLFLITLLFTGVLSAQLTSSYTMYQNIDTMHPDLSKSSCSSPEGSMQVLNLTTFDYDYLFDNNYCYPGNATTSTTTKCFTFIAPTSSLNLDAGFTEYCNNVIFGPFRLYRSTTCVLVSTSLSPSNLIVGQSYTWCVTMRAYGGGCNGFTTFCPYYTPNIPLPLQFIDFKGTCTNLFWQTASEDNVSHFTIEKSIDGKHWENIGTEQAMGTTTFQSNYSFEISQNEDLAYYQLWEHDFDGNYVFLKRISVGCPKARQIEVIYDVNGRIIGNKLPISKGIYFIVYSDGTTQRIIN
jgi:hypothetical protein